MEKLKNIISKYKNKLLISSIILVSFVLVICIYLLVFDKGISFSSVFKGTYGATVDCVSTNVPPNCTYQGSNKCYCPDGTSAPTCDTGYHVENNQCVKDYEECTGDKYSSSDSCGRSTHSTCKKSGNCFVLDISACYDGYYSYGGQCKKCDEDNWCTGGNKYPCDDGYSSPAGSKSKDSCVKDIECSSNSDCDDKCSQENFYSTCSDGTCSTCTFKCPTGYYADNQACLVANGYVTCSEVAFGTNKCYIGNKIAVDDKCEAGYYLKSGFCYICSAGHYCPGGKKGEQDCPANSYCPAGSPSAVSCPAMSISSKKSTSVSDCKCKDGYEWKDNTCKAKTSDCTTSGYCCWSCGGVEKWQEGKGTCSEPVALTDRNKDGQINNFDCGYTTTVNDCPSCSTGWKKVLLSNGECSCEKPVESCPAGEYLTNGKCVTCPVGKYCPGGADYYHSCGTKYTTDGTGKTSISDCNVCASGYTESGKDSSQCVSETSCAAKDVTCCYKVDGEYKSLTGQNASGFFVSFGECKSVSDDNPCGSGYSDKDDCEDATHRTCVEDNDKCYIPVAPSPSGDGGDDDDKNCKSGYKYNSKTGICEEVECTYYELEECENNTHFKCEKKTGKCYEPSSPKECIDGYKFNSEKTNCIIDTGDDSDTEDNDIGNDNSGNNGEGNVSGNPQTGEIAIFSISVMMLGAICYSFYYFKNMRKD